MTAVVAIDARAARAWPGALQGIAFAAPGVVVVGLGGEVLRIREDGGVEEVLAGGHPRGGAATDPCASQRGVSTNGREWHGNRPHPR